VIDASLNATQDLTEAKKASLIGAVVSIAAENGVEEERQIRATLMDIVDQRVQRLENRIALMDDVEALLEAERVSLELERRDMYTTRCRQWFGDGSS
jgi:SWI/SNF related-matrix-associated actin-dependent regulator of chromatin subfamily C